MTETLSTIGKKSLFFIQHMNQESRHRAAPSNTSTQCQLRIAISTTVCECAKLLEKKPDRLPEIPMLYYVIGSTFINRIL